MIEPVQRSRDICVNGLGRAAAARQSDGVLSSVHGNAANDTAASASGFRSVAGATCNASCPGEKPLRSSAHASGPVFPTVSPRLAFWSERTISRAIADDGGAETRVGAPRRAGGIGTRAENRLRRQVWAPGIQPSRRRARGAPNPAFAPRVGCAARARQACCVSDAWLRTAPRRGGMRRGSRHQSSRRRRACRARRSICRSTSSIQPRLST